MTATARRVVYQYGSLSAWTVMVDAEPRGRRSGRGGVRTDGGRTVLFSRHRPAGRLSWFVGGRHTVRRRNSRWRVADVDSTFRNYSGSKFLSTERTDAHVDSVRRFHFNVSPCVHSNSSQSQREVRVVRLGHAQVKKLITGHVVRHAMRAVQARRGR